jgi:hypothetical protein
MIENTLQRRNSQKKEGELIFEQMKLNKKGTNKKAIGKEMIRLLNK